MFHKYWHMLALGVSLCFVSAYPISDKTNVVPICVLRIVFNLFKIFSNSRIWGHRLASAKTTTTTATAAITTTTKKQKQKQNKTK